MHILLGLLKDVENFNTRANDIIIASFPKSGTTWVQEIVHQISMLQATKKKLQGDETMNSKVCHFIILSIFRNFLENFRDVFIMIEKVSPIFYNRNHRVHKSHCQMRPMS